MKYLTPEEGRRIKAAELARWYVVNACTCMTTNGKVHRNGCPRHHRSPIKLEESK